MVGVHLVDKYRTVLSTMTNQICLPVAVDIKRADHSPSLDWKLPDGRSNGLAIPCHFARKTHIHGEQAGHNYLLIKP